jgi:hypothetical protein
MYIFLNLINAGRMEHICVAICPEFCIILKYRSLNKMHLLQSLFYLTIALHVSGIIITHLQEHKTTVTTASGSNSSTITTDNNTV